MTRPLTVRYQQQEDVDIDHVLADLEDNPSPTDDEILDAVFNLLDGPCRGEMCELLYESSIVDTIRSRLENPEVET